MAIADVCPTRWLACQAPRGQMLSRSEAVRAMVASLYDYPSEPVRTKGGRGVILRRCLQSIHIGTIWSFQ